MKLFKNLFNDPSQITKAVTGDPFEFKELITTISTGTIQCEISQSIRKIDKTKGTTFTYETNFYKTNKQTNFPQNLQKKLKTLNHSTIPKIYEIKESGSKLIITTEEMYPLTNKLNEMKKYPDLLIWAIYNIVRNIDYLHSKGFLHGNLRPNTIFITKSMELKVFGLEFLSELSSLNNSPFENKLQTDPQILEDIYLPPDVLNYKVNAKGVDCWSVAGIIGFLFGAQFRKKTDICSCQNIPKELLNWYKSISSSSHGDRNNVGSLLQTPFITQNRFLSIINMLERFGQLDTMQRDNFLKNLVSNFESLPPSFRQFKLLECFIEIMKNGKNESSSVVEPMLKLAINLSQEDFDSDVLPTLKHMLQNGTKEIKQQLLNHCKLYIEKVPEQLVMNYLYPMINKSMEKEATTQMKDAAVKSLVCLAPKLSESTINGEIFKFLQSMLNETENILKINTVVCIGKICHKFNRENRIKLISESFSRAMKSNLLDMKKAAYIMISSNKYYIDPTICCKEIAPYIAIALVDSDSQIRKAALECWDVISVICKEYSMTIDNPSYQPKYPKQGEQIKISSGAQPAQVNMDNIWGNHSTSFTPQTAADLEKKEVKVEKKVEKNDEQEQQKNVQQNVQPKQEQKPAPKPAMQADDWDSWASTFEQQMKTKQPQIAYGNYTSTPVQQPKPQPKPQPKKSSNAGGWGFDFDSDFGSNNNNGNVPSFI